jgi:hypothetical protein
MDHGYERNASLNIGLIEALTTPWYPVLATQGAAIRDNLSTKRYLIHRSLTVETPKLMDNLRFKVKLVRRSFLFPFKIDQRKPKALSLMVTLGQLLARGIPTRLPNPQEPIHGISSMVDSGPDWLLTRSQ